jgi:hypothetical protein
MDLSSVISTFKSPIYLEIARNCDHARWYTPSLFNVYATWWFESIHLNYVQLIIFFLKSKIVEWFQFKKSLKRLNLELSLTIFTPI